jgi:hypothetical protein
MTEWERGNEGAASLRGRGRLRSAGALLAGRWRVLGGLEHGNLGTVKAGDAHPVMKYTPPG